MFNLRARLGGARRRLDTCASMQNRMDPCSKSVSLKLDLLLAALNTGSPDFSS